MPPIAQYFSSSHSSIPYDEPSRPIPDSFTPPNGATSVEMSPVLMPTMPYSSASADPRDAPEPLRVEVRGEPVRRVVGDPHGLLLGREARDARHRAEGLLAAHRHVRGDVDEHGRLEELALDPRAADEELRPSLERVRHVPLDLLDGRLVDERADVDAVR